MNDQVIDALIRSELRVITHKKRSPLVSVASVACSFNASLKPGREMTPQRVREGLEQYGYEIGKRRGRLDVRPCPTVKEIRDFAWKHGFRGWAVSENMADDFIRFHESKGWIDEQGRPLTEWEGAFLDYALEQSR